MITVTAWALYLTVYASGIALSKQDAAAYGFITGNIKRWKADARLFVREALNVTPDLWQDDALALVANPKTRRLAMKACKGPGKTAVLAWIILWFLTCHPNSKVGCTSITEGNIDANLWPELFKWIDASPFLGAMFKWSRTQVTRRGAAGANWFAVKRTWPKSGSAEEQANALAGLHADYVMFVLDESGGIPQGVMVTAEAVLANLTEAAIAAGFRAIVVQAGNPTHTTGPLHRACTAERHLWHVITITGDPDDPKRSPRISLTHAREQIELWGRDNPWVLVNILGQFPPASINALLGIEDVEAAMKRRLQPKDYNFAQKRLGVDVARFGDDRTVLAPRQGRQAFKMEVLRHQNTMRIADRVERAHVVWKPEVIFIDDTGHWGHGVIDRLLEPPKDFEAKPAPVVPAIYSMRSPDKRYKTVRDLMWVELAKWVKAGGALPNDPELVRELTEITYTFDGGQFRVEDKKMLKARIGVSPDKADALAETFLFPEMPAHVFDLEQHFGPGAGNPELLALLDRLWRPDVRADFDPFKPGRVFGDEDTGSAVGVLEHDWDPFA